MKKRLRPIAKKRHSAAGSKNSKNGLKVILSEQQIRRRVREMAKQINKDYAGKTLHVVGILQDCFMFMPDLVRALTIPVVCSFVRSRVRDTDTGLVAMREIMYIPPVDAAGKDILLVHGILQSGVTLDHLRRTLEAQQPASVRIATLLDKTKERKVDIKVDYAGFELSGRFLVGYGLGFQEQYRQLPYLAGII
jgi:hypoxanthine phosphoribosyltransferase